MTRLARQSDGLVIVRHGPPGLWLSHIFAELRPDRAVKTGPPTWHSHSATRSDAPTYPETGEPLPRKHVHTADAMRKHIERGRSDDDHRGGNNEDVHKHQPRGKYVFPPSLLREVSWRHDHDDAYVHNPEKRADHVARAHDGADVDGLHTHSRMMKDRRISFAKRIDVHPLAADKIKAASRVFFGIEGCIKADAILSAGGAVFSVPSVTLWDADELPAFAEMYLGGKQIVIVPDADWFLNPAVMTQAMLCRSSLRRLRLEACIAAPPIDGVKLGIKGIDDYLGKGRGTMEQLDVIERETAFGLAEWLVRRGGRKDKIIRAAEVLESLALHACPEGTIRAPLRTIARVMDVNVSRVSRAVEDLASVYGAIVVDKPLATQRGVWHGNYYDRELEWQNRPTITIDPELRAVDSSHKLGSATVGEGLSKVRAG
jgi:hypothetical protein